MNDSIMNLRDSESDCLVSSGSGLCPIAGKCSESLRYQVQLSVKVDRAEYYYIDSCQRVSPAPMALYRVLGGLDIEEFEGFPKGEVLCVVTDGRHWVVSDTASALDAYRLGKRKINYRFELSLRYQPQAQEEDDTDLPF